jgi:flagellar P-ring protein precursor FlgI
MRRHEKNWINDQDRIKGYISSLVIAGLVLAIALIAPATQAARVKDIASIAGVRSNQLIGYGLVVGLNGSGDKVNSSPFTEQSLRSMLTQLGIVVPAGTTLNPKNVAAVTIHADLPPFAKPGQKIDVTVSSIGDAKSLRGGTLLMAPLKGADGKVYAIAQGNLVVGGLSASGADGSSITINIPSVGRIPNGASVERMVATPFSKNNFLVLNLHRSDFTTARRVVDSINKAIGPNAAKAIDATSIRVDSPMDPAQRVSFVSLLENLEVDPGLAPARVVVNSRTGTVVISSEVRVSPAAVSHGNLTVTISEEQQVSQPNALASGETTVVPSTQVDVKESGSRMFLFNTGVTLNEVVRAVNQVGAAPSDLVAILEALKQAGSLKAELIVI